MINPWKKILAAEQKKLDKAAKGDFSAIDPLEKQNWGEAELRKLQEAGVTDFSTPGILNYYVKTKGLNPNLWKLSPFEPDQKAIEEKVTGYTMVDQGNKALGPVYTGSIAISPNTDLPTRAWNIPHEVQHVLDRQRKSGDYPPPGKHHLEDKSGFNLEFDIKNYMNNLRREAGQEELP